MDVRREVVRPPEAKVPDVVMDRALQEVWQRLPEKPWTVADLEALVRRVLTEEGLI